MKEKQRGTRGRNLRLAGAAGMSCNGHGGMDKRWGFFRCPAKQIHHFPLFISKACRFPIYRSLCSLLSSPILSNPPPSNHYLPLARFHTSNTKPSKPFTSYLASPLDHLAPLRSHLIAPPTLPVFVKATSIQSDIHKRQQILTITNPGTISLSLLELSFD